MRLRLLFVSFLALLPVAAQAQQNSDTQQILQLLQGMNGRLGTIEKRLDKVEQGQGPAAEPTESDAAPADAATPATPQPAPAGASASTPPAGVAVPGWKIDVFPYEKDGVASAPIARSRAPTGKTFFNLHFAGGPVSSSVMYKGKAYFWAKQPGTYTFNVYIDPSKANGYHDCEAQMSAEGNEVVKYFTTSSPASQSGSVDLQEGKYLLDYSIGCWLRHNDDKTQKLGSYEMTQYQNMSYTISVIGPEDSSLREFDRDELFIIVPPDRAKKKQSALETPFQPTAYAEEDPAPSDAFAAQAPPASVVVSMTGTGVTTAPANFRSGPSKSARTAYMLPEGTPLQMLQQIDRWYRVQVRNGDVGFVHASLVAPLLHD